MPFGLASRLARREVRRRPGRTLLVALLVALPTIALGGAAIIAATAQRTPTEKYRASYGTADFVVDASSPTVEGAPVDPAAALLTAARATFGAATRVATHATSSLAARVQDATVARGTRSKYLVVISTDLRDRLIAPLYDLRSGRSPQTVDEVVVSSSLADAWHLEPGDTLTLSRPASSATVVGVVRDRNRYSWTGVLGLAGNRFALPENAGRVFLLVDTPQPVSYSQSLGVNKAGFSTQRERVYTPDHNEFAAPSDPVLLLGSVFAIVGFAVLSIIVTAAFATSARRQLVTIGQLTSNGAPGRLVRTSLALQGAWSAVVGLVVSAMVLGLGFGFGRSALADLVGRDVPHLSIPIGQLITVAVIAVLSSTVAAYLPARSATRVSVLDALAGRRPLASVPRRLLPIGIVALAAGVGLELLTTLAVTGQDGGSSSNAFLVSGAVGALLILAGMCCASPAIVSVLGPLARRLRGAGRLTARSIARSRPRTAAVVAAIAAFAAVGIAVSTFQVTDRAHSGVMNAYLPDNVVLLTANSCPNERSATTQQAETDPTRPYESCTLTDPDADSVSEVDDILSGAARTTLRWATFDPAPYDPTAPPVTDAIALQEPGAIAVATPQLLDLMGVSSGDRTALSTTGLLAVSDPVNWLSTPSPPLDQSTGLLSLTLRTRAGDRAVRAATNRDPLRYYGLANSILITDAKANSLDLAVRDIGTLYSLPQSLREDQRVELSFLYGGMLRPSESGESTSLNLAFSYVRPPTSSGVIETLIALAILVVTLLIVAIGLALTAAESKDERDVLVSVGARPRTLSSLSGLRAFVLSAFGVLLAVPVGLVPTIVVIRASQAGEAIPEGPVVPWLTIVLLLCIPFVAYAAARTASAIARRVRPVRLSNSAFD
jgi:putative ABC transport system permease protein